MTDVTLDRYLVWGTAADRAAFTPNPGVGTTGTNILPIWVDSDVNGNPAWFWDTATSDWLPWAVGGGSGRTFFQYKAKVSATSGYPGDGYMLWNNATQTSATSLLFAHITDDGIDVDLFLAFIASGDTVIIQDANASANFQTWTVSGSPVNTNPGASNSYWTVPVTLVTSGGVGTTGFTANTRLIAAVFPAASGGGITQLTGDVTAGPGSGSQAATIANNAVTDTKLRQGTALTVIGRSANSTGNVADIAAGSDGQVLRRSGTSLGFGAVNLASANAVTGLLPLANLAARTTSMGLVIDGGGSTITTGVKGDLYIPVACTITANTMLADQSGSIVVDIWKNTYASYPPTVANTITASALPTISSAVKSQDSTLTGWTTACSAGDTLRFNVNSCTSITRLALSLTVTVP